MAFFSLKQYALGVCVSLIMLAGCGNATQSSQTLPLGTSGALTTLGHWPRSVRHASVTETVLYSFGRQGDGAEPFSGLTYYHGTFYGTTLEGGGTGCVHEVGCGIVFSITPSGTETVLYRFMGGQDGASPSTDLINVHGTFYGTTGYGGTSNDGTVFSIVPLGTEAILHSFTGPPDGWRPGDRLLNINGTMYGTTREGGAGPRGGGGTVFTITPSGSETVSYSFRGYKVHGESPTGRLVKVDGILYGATRAGWRVRRGGGLFAS